MASFDMKRTIDVLVQEFARGKGDSNKVPLAKDGILHPTPFNN